MSNNTKIFSEAIAEAKAIRETAMANAKLALEEAFAPRIQEMMSDKLEALAEEDEMEEGYGSEETQNEEISLEELLAELEGLDESADEEKMEENTIAEAESEDEVGEITVDELKDIIRDVLSDVMGGEEEEEGTEEMEAGEEMEASEDDLELEEILAEIASLEEGEDEDLEEGLGDFAKKVGEKVKGAVGPGGSMEKGITWADEKMTKFGKESGIYDKSDKLAQKAIDAKQKALGKAPLGKGFGVVEGELEEWGTGAAAGNFSSKSTGKELDIQLANAVKSAAKNVGMSVQDFMKKILAQPGEKSAPRETSWNESAELEEAMNTIATLRSELNEVNLLNAKLLYVNKLFKAKNLTESQKVKVINAFDRAETVKEAKNVFETLNESLTTEKAKSQIKESLSFASKAAGVADRKPIMENIDSTTARWQKLAGIIK